MIGWILSTLVLGALVVIGVAGLVAPHASSSQYGIVLDDRAHRLARTPSLRPGSPGALTLGPYAPRASRGKRGRA